mmetsp:Transcript_5933/g.13793  ORF Transcript_5933/g.13793 Transcript_5933/m.13793 type:complete len:308 (-) Transcript_5933:366-1289(-)
MERRSSTDVGWCTGGGACGVAPAALASLWTRELRRIHCSPLAYMSKKTLLRKLDGKPSGRPGSCRGSNGATPSSEGAAPALRSTSRSCQIETGERRSSSSKRQLATLEPKSAGSPAKSLSASLGLRVRRVVLHQVVACGGAADGAEDCGRFASGLCTRGRWVGRAYASVRGDQLLKLGGRAPSDGGGARAQMAAGGGGGCGGCGGGGCGSIFGRDANGEGGACATGPGGGGGGSGGSCEGRGGGAPGAKSDGDAAGAKSDADAAGIELNARCGLATALACVPQTACPGVESTTGATDACGGRLSIDV